MNLGASSIRQTLRRRCDNTPRGVLRVSVDGDRLVVARKGITRVMGGPIR